VSAARALAVVAGVLFDDQGRVLLAQRPLKGADAGLWEFAGGKIRPGEAATAALAREFQEELGVRVIASERLLSVRWRAAPRPLNLHVYKVTNWQGEPRALEHAALRWVPLCELINYPMPGPDRPVRARLALPANYLISPEPTSDPDEFTGAFSRSIVNRELGIVSLRAKGMAPDRLAALATRVLGCARELRPDLLVLMHGAVDLAQSLGFDGVHLSSRQLEQYRARPLPESKWVFASCHDEHELIAAQNLGVDAATLSPLHPTASHPDSRPLGWHHFARLTARTWLPVYGLGGLTRTDLSMARSAGAQGVAAIRAYWEGEPSRPRNSAR
jgi:8-oxo-dGTP diphosphatase